jgi:hypothetical protein
MPGLQDEREQRELTQPDSRDGARLADSPETADRPARDSAADLRQRLGRLPYGHPSSPYHDDGTAKPPLVQLKNLELPLPGDSTDQEAGVQDRQSVVREPDRGQPEREPADREPIAWEPADWEPEDRPAADGEHEPAAHEPELAPDREPGPDHDEPATQDQPAIADDLAPAPIEQPDTRQPEPLTPEQVRIAVRAHGQCRLAEGRSVFGSYGETGLTPAMRRVEEQLEHGELVQETEKYALKSLDRFQEKLSKLIKRNPDKAPDELANEIHDGIRYTFVFDEESYHDATWQAHSQLEQEGFDLEFRRNTWTNPEYKGINSRWRDSEHSILFEVQFHTMVSWDVKQRTHDAYAKISDTTISCAERKQLRAAQEEVSATVPLPPRCTEIPDYRKEGT